MVLLTVSVTVLMMVMTLFLLGATVSAETT
jgi:hypothetical protein